MYRTVRRVLGNDASANPVASLTCPDPLRCRFRSALTHMGALDPLLATRWQHGAPLVGWGVDRYIGPTAERHGGGGVMSAAQGQATWRGCKSIVTDH